MKLYHVNYTYMARAGKPNIELNFVRSGEGKSQRDKIKSFWEFIDSQKELVPFRPPQAEAGSKVNDLNPSVCKNSERSRGCKRHGKRSSGTVSNQESCGNDSQTEVCNAECQTSPKTGIWYDELRIFKELGLDRVALVASDACKRCLKDERNDVEKEPEFADLVPQSYDELTAELEAFQQRVKHPKQKYAYKDPGKYEHLIK